MAGRDGMTVDDFDPMARTERASKHERIAGQKIVAPKRTEKEIAIKLQEMRGRL